MAKRSTENKELIGASPLEVFTRVVDENPQIYQVNFWKYVYRPRKFEESGINPHWMDREVFLKNKALPELIQNLSEDEQLGIFSKVIMRSGDVAHIPMMDFDLPKSNRGLSVLKERIERASIRNAWILETEKSYHLYGKELLSEDEWVGFMGDCLLTSIVHNRGDIEQVADSRYIGHSLKRGGNVLRLTTKADKTFEPRVVDFVK